MTESELKTKKLQLQEQLNKLEPIANQYVVSDDKVYDFNPFIYFLTQGMIYKAGEVFEDISMNALEDQYGRTKAGQALNKTAWYSLAGVAALAIGALSIPFAILETPISLPMKIHEEMKINRLSKHNSRVVNARHKVSLIKEQISNIDQQLANTQQDTMQL